MKKRSEGKTLKSDCTVESCSRQLPKIYPKIKLTEMKQIVDQGDKNCREIPLSLLDTIEFVCLYHICNSANLVTNPQV